MLTEKHPGTHSMRFAIAFLSIGLTATAVRAADPAEFFEKNVRPVLVEKCLSCHTGEKPKGGLRLDSREAILHGGRGGRGDRAGQAE